MADKTEISWTDATFNPWIGCTKVSPGCDNCYAARQDGFRKWTPEGWGAGMPRKRTKTWGAPVKWNISPFFECAECSTACRWRGECNGESCPGCGGHVVPARRRVFCASLADVFDNEVDPEWRADLFELIGKTPNLDWLVLTKRIGNAAGMIQAALARLRLGGYDLKPWPWPNFWLGATVVNQEEADRDIPKLLATPARVRFLSMEPLLGPVDLTDLPGADRWRIDALRGVWERHNHSRAFDEEPNLERNQGGPHVDWVIVGGESGPGARPMHPAWAQNLRDQCAAAGVPLHFKQWGEWAPYDRGRTPDKHLLVDPTCLDTPIQRFGKKLSGRLLDGVTHDAFPEATK